MENIQDLIKYLEERIESENRFALMGDLSSKLLVEEFTKIIKYLNQITESDYIKS